MSKSKPDYLDFNTIIAQCDRELIAERILAVEEGEKEIAEFDFEDSKRLIWLAGEKWLARDLSQFSLDDVEKEVFMDVDRQAKPFHGFLDLAGTVKGTIEPFKQFAGQKYIVDWKTSKNTLSTEWRTRLVDSLQWMCYSKAYEAAIFLYRGLSRNGTLAEIIIKVPESNGEEVIQHLTAVGDHLNVLRANEYLVYPRNKPFACNAYGKECQFYQDCVDFTMPRAKLSDDKALSYSFMNTFMLCPEKARRESLIQDGVGSEETAFGRACHRGLAELWKQAFKIYGNL